MTTAEAATTSAPESLRASGRPESGAAVARTEELYARHGRLVSGLCRALLRDRAEAEDASQQTFLAAHRALLNGTAPREPAAWLATIARNECWARIRARMREPLPAAEIDAESHAADPLGEAIRRADLAALWQAVSELPQPQRDALLLREFGGLSYAELAEALAVTGPAVESLLFRARQGLRVRLQTAYTAVSGMSFVDTLARLLGGASGSAAPVVAKAVVVAGVGAAVATGGAVVAPHVFFDHPRTAPLRAVHASARPLRQAPSVPVSAAVAAGPAVRNVLALASPAALRERRDSSSGDRSELGGSADGHTRAATEREGTDGSTRGSQPAQGGFSGSESGSTSASGGDAASGGGSGSSDGTDGQAAGTATLQPDAGGAGATSPVPNPAVSTVAPSEDSASGSDD